MLQARQHPEGLHLPVKRCGSCWHAPAQPAVPASPRPTPEQQQVQKLAQQLLQVHQQGHEQAAQAAGLWTQLLLGPGQQLQQRWGQMQQQRQQQMQHGQQGRQLV